MSDAELFDRASEMIDAGLSTTDVAETLQVLYGAGKHRAIRIASMAFDPSGY